MVYCGSVIMKQQKRLVFTLRFALEFVQSIDTEIQGAFHFCAPSSSRSVG